jgi:hypothetical protein
LQRSRLRKKISKQNEDADSNGDNGSEDAH